MMELLIELACYTLSLMSEIVAQGEMMAEPVVVAIEPVTAITQQIVETPTLETEQPAPEGLPLAEPAQTTTERKVVHHPTAVYQPADENHILSWWDYVHTYEGLCPHEQPDNAQGSEFKQEFQWLAAIGATSVDRSPEQVLEQYWSYWRAGLISGIINHHFNDESRLVVDWDTLTAPDSQFHTDLIRGFEERYITHCPND